MDKKIVLTSKIESGKIAVGKEYMGKIVAKIGASFFRDNDPVDYCIYHSYTDKVTAIYLK